MNEKEFLDSYNPSAYNTPKGLPVDICMFTITSKGKPTVRKSLPEREAKVLLIKRKGHPYKDMWALPGGFSREEESLDEAAKRELKEETNVGEDVHIEQLKTVYYPGRDKRGWMPTVVYFALVNERHLINLQAADDASDAKLFTVSEALSMPLAFDHHDIIKEAYDKVREKMLDTSIAKEFLEKEFTIAELLQVIQVVVPEFKVEKSNFIRKMVSTETRKGLLEEAKDANGKHKTSDRNSNREAKLYHFSEHIPKVSIYNSTLF
jgi:ADP-ribose pyrophosphatase YjhB (NUDIX family)